MDDTNCIAVIEYPPCEDAALCDRHTPAWFVDSYLNFLPQLQLKSRSCFLSVRIWLVCEM